MLLYTRRCKNTHHCTIAWALSAWHAQTCNMRKFLQVKFSTVQYKEYIAPPSTNWWCTYATQVLTVAVVLELCNIWSYNIKCAAQMSIAAVCFTDVVYEISEVITEPCASI